MTLGFFFFFVTLGFLFFFVTLGFLFFRIVSLRELAHFFKMTRVFEK